MLVNSFIIIYIDRKTGRKTKELKSWMSNTSFSMKNGLKNRMKNKISIHFDHLWINFDCKRWYFIVIFILFNMIYYREKEENHLIVIGWRLEKVELNWKWIWLHERMMDKHCLNNYRIWCVDYDSESFIWNWLSIEGRIDDFMIFDCKG